MRHFLSTFVALASLATSAHALVGPTTLAPMLQPQPRALAPAMTAATKPQRTNMRRRAYNKMYNSAMKTAIKRVFEACDSGDYAVATVKLSAAQKAIDKNVKRNIIHKNTAARRKSRLAHAVKALEAGAAAAPAAPAAVPEVAAAPAPEAADASEAES